MHLSHKIKAFLGAIGEEEVTGKQVSQRLGEQGLQYTPKQASAFMNYRLLNKYLQKRRVYTRKGETYTNHYRIIQGILP